MIFLGVTFLLAGLLVAGWNVWQCFEANRCPACKKDFALRSRAECIDTTRQEHYEVVNLAPNVTERRLVGTTTSRVYRVDITCVYCDYARQDELTESDYSEAFYGSLHRKLIVWLPALMFPISAICGLTALFGYRTLFPIAFVLAGVITFFYFKYLWRDVITRRAKWQVTAAASVLMLLGGGIGSIGRNPPASDLGNSINSEMQDEEKKK